MKKRLLSFVLAVLMIASLLPVTALAADIVASGTCGAEDSGGNNLMWMLDSEGTLTISGTGKMDYYTTTLRPPWKKYQDDIKTVQIDDGVTSIGQLAFCGLHSLTSITIPSSVAMIGNYSLAIVLL